MITIETLTQHGFKLSGEWIISANKIKSQLLATCKDIANAKNIVYAFSSNGEVFYIGESAPGIASRFSGYRNPTKKNNADTDAKVNHEIYKRLRQGNSIEIYVAQPVVMFSLTNGKTIPLQVRVALEEYLITLDSPNGTLINKKRTQCSVNPTGNLIPIVDKLSNPRGKYETLYLEDEFKQWLINVRNISDVSTYCSDARKGASRLVAPPDADAKWYAAHAQYFRGESFSSSWASYCKFMQQNLS